MKYLLISNSNLAEEMYHAMQNFYTKPDIDFITLSNRTSNDFAIKLKTYLANTSEEILILCDCYGSTAFNEATYLLQELNLLQRSTIISGMNLPITFKLYGLKDSWDIHSIKALYQNPESGNHGVLVYEQRVG